MRSTAMRKAASAFVIATIAVVTSCSLIAPSDEEAMRGLSSGTSSDAATDSATTDAQDGAAAEGGDAGPVGPTPECGACPRACNGGTTTCSACLLNGGKCRGDADCCSSKCLSGQCGPPVGACKPAGDQSCQAAPDDCCAGTSCNQDRNRCATCGPNDDNCVVDTDCCSVRCGNGGKCAACVFTGACTSNRQCCSNVCDTKSGTCQ